MNNPTLHKSIPMLKRVKIMRGIQDALIGVTGEVVGIATEGVIYNYIVLLDKPLEDVPDVGTVKAVCIPGIYLEGEDGTSYQTKIRME